MPIKFNFLNPLKLIYKRSFTTNTSSIPNKNKLVNTEILKKYPHEISPEKLDKMLKICKETQDQSYRFLKMNIESRYPKEINAESLDKTLKEAAATRTKFSIY